eukprot:COSAG01_NODE_39297_length_478_cov_1.224274_1_plen_152_part_10
MPAAVWPPNEHPCLWGGDVAGLQIFCCLRGDGTHITSATVTGVDVNQYVHLHRANMHVSSFRGQIPEAVGNLTSLRIFHVGPSLISGSLPNGLSTLPITRLYISNTLQTGIVPQINYPGLGGVFMRNVVHISGTLPANFMGSEDMMVMMFQS